MRNDDVKLTVRLFATVQMLVGKKLIEISIQPGISVGEFKKHLIAKYPQLARIMPDCIIAIDRRFSQDDDILPDAADIAVFPPVSGGAGLLEIIDVTRRPIKTDRVIMKLSSISTGAIASFTGVVRGLTRGNREAVTTMLEYQAYISMAKEKMHQIVVEIHKRWPDVEGIAILQRTGRLRPGTPSVFIACSAGHRDSGVFEATRYAIDRLKEIVPVWKKEFRQDGRHWIEGHYLPKKGD